ncbi:MAG: DNA-binding response regulator [Micavibrio sp.]|nr:DNA-binding response regulator [Micavibrio sp.]|tara:strand:- start:530 stop:1243 length:714 start_codon:yes stop_codon:yes gene_type:complete
MKKGTILSIDDDENLQTVTSQYLEDDGYKIISALNAASALEKIENSPIDVILLDLVLPDGEGLSLIPQFMSKSNAAIIIVSGKSDTTEKIICLEMGADDYITKPFEMRELSARIKAVMRRKGADKSNKDTASNEPTQDIIEFEKWKIDRAQYQVFDKNNVSLDFTTGEFQLLNALVSAPNRALSREQLFELTRDGEFDAYDRAIDIQVARIRKKLNDDDNEIIRTVRGIGYMFSNQK